MKRSQMVELIYKLIQNKDYLSKEDANELLTEIEIFGMRPPNDYHDDYGVYPWEKEED